MKWARQKGRLWGNTRNLPPQQQPSMKTFNAKTLLPHLAAIAIFIIVALIYCKPALQGKVLQQGDIVHFTGMSKDIHDYAEKHDGVAPLWTTSMFGGMPGFQISTNNNNYLSYYANEVFSLFIPKPFRFFILACLGFYFLALVSKVNPWLGTLGALGYAYSTFDPVIVAAGHDTQMLSTAYLPALVGGLLMIYEGRFWLGAALTALFSSIMVFHNHYQVTYYFLIIAAFITLYYIVKWVKEKDYKTMVTALAFAAVAGGVGVLTNAVMLFTTYDYSKATIRGGQSPLNIGDSLSAKPASSGLDTSYAFRWSYGILESFTMIVPNIYGGASQPVGEDSKLVQVMAEKALPPQFSNQLYGALGAYWGNQPFTSGPVYLGAIFCLLFLFGMVYLKGTRKWWLLGLTVLALLMAWGKNFGTFNAFLFEHLPMYNKFRAPAFVLVIPQLVFPMVSILALNELIFGQIDRAEAWKKLKLTGIIMGGIFAFLAVLYFGFDYHSGTDRMIQDQLSKAVPNNPSFGRDMINAVAADRKSLFGSDLLRSLLFVAAGFALLFFYIRGKVKANWVIGGFILLALLDLVPAGKRYMSNDNFVEPEDSEAPFAMTAADVEIKKDTDPDYRVLNLTQDVFNDAITSYHHKSVGGYHAAKLSIYQDLIEYQFSRKAYNPNVLNMLNTRYAIVADSANRPVVQRNPGALGHAWLVKGIRWVKGPREEMLSLDNFNPADTAIVQESYKPSVTISPKWDSTASITLTTFDNDKLNYAVKSSADQFAVFSEVYYNRGWKAFIDGKEAPIVKVNYVLRGLAIPGGNHAIEFRFEPRSYSQGRKTTNAAQFALVLLLAVGIFMEWRRNKAAENRA
jgi:hypothetical protein